MISIIIPVYNHSKELGHCLDSILCQSFKDIEVIVVNDGSTDDVGRVVDRYKKRFNDLGILLSVIHQGNMGANHARNRGFSKSIGDFIIFLDADIKMKDDMLQKMFNKINESPHSSYVYSSFKFGFKTFELWPFSAKKLKQIPYIHTSSLIRRKHFPGFDEKIKKMQDWDLWLTMLSSGYRGVWISEVLFKIKTRANGISYWFPGFFYKIPFSKFGIKIKRIDEYNIALKRIKEKHKIET